MEFFRNSNIDFLGKKWYFLAFSLIFSVAGLFSLFFWHGLPLGVDFRGGTLVYVKFTQRPDENHVRSLLAKAGLTQAKLQRIGQPEMNELLISLDIQETSEQALDAGKNTIIQALEGTSPDPNKKDLNNASSQSVFDALLTADPVRAGTDANQRYQAIAQQIVDLRDKEHGGVFSSFDQLKVLDPNVVQVLQSSFYLSNFGVRNVEIVGPQVGKQLQIQAYKAIGLSLLGMLVYLWFRFELIYGVAAVVAVFHDTLITVGAFSMLNKEISLTVIAAILTLTGYSMNDTIVVFDRIRENVKLMRRESLAQIVNISINQTLSRTILTSGLTFLTVLSLFLFGGEVLHGFSFALVIGILIGTYSSIFIAAPMLVAYQGWRANKKGLAAQAVSLPAARSKEKARAR
ncbi:MAG TPA: protein translocase subunit SecF [Terriglobales bacterium]|nr:protein translocase subunit SecF [Terriglobales bacterium]